MTARANARLAGSAFLLYIVVGITHLIVFGQATRGADTAAQLASLAAHEPLARVTILLALFEALCALTLGLTLWALTREVDRDLAVMGLCCRAGEGVLVAISPAQTLALLWLANRSGATPAEAAATNALGGLLLAVGLGGLAAVCFGLGSLLFSWLFVRGRGIPPALGWLGLI